MRTAMVVMVIALTATSIAAAQSDGGVPGRDLSRFSFAELARGGMVRTDFVAEADRAINSFAKLVSDANARQLGFENAAQARLAKRGEPLREFVIRLDDLRNFTGDLGSKILSGGNRWLFPLTVDGVVRSSITLAQVGSGWRSVAFGSPHLIVAAATVRDRRASVLHGGPPALFILIRVPALNAVFVADVVNGVISLTPLFDDSSLGMKAGETKGAAEALRGLLRAARGLADAPT